MSSSNIHILSVSRYRFGLSFLVQGETGEYTVDWNIYKGWICDCPHHLFRHAYCKHIAACKKYVLEHGLLLHDKLWFDDPKSDIVVNGESATSHTLVEEAVKNGSY